MSYGTLSPIRLLPKKRLRVPSFHVDYASVLIKLRKGSVLAVCMQCPCKMQCACKGSVLASECKCV